MEQEDLILLGHGLSDFVAGYGALQESCRYAETDKVFLSNVEGRISFLTGH